VTRNTLSVNYYSSSDSENYKHILDSLAPEIYTREKGAVYCTLCSRALELGDKSTIDYKGSGVFKHVEYVRGRQEFVADDEHGGYKIERE
jgi:CRISPR/Cas system-associated protein Cas7 (RAMP superfamily)